MRLRNIKDALEILQKSGYLVEEYPVNINNKYIIELGMGKGEMITELANQDPSMQFIGVERYDTVALKAAQKAEGLKLKNFQIINQDVAKLPEILKGNVDLIWLTFSDPWPKVRHEKRRLTFKTFLEIYRDILSDKGVIKLKTDNDKFFEYSVESMKEFGMKLTNVTNDYHTHKACKGNVMTGYEKKWSESGKKINYLEARF